MTLSKALSPNVQLVTLQSLAPDEVLLRLAHQFGVGEDTALSQPVEVSLSLFAHSSTHPCIIIIIIIIIIVVVVVVVYIIIIIILYIYCSMSQSVIFLCTCTSSEV